MPASLSSISLNRRVVHTWSSADSTQGRQPDRADKLDEHVELLQLDRSGIRVAACLTELPPRKFLKRKLHGSALRAKARHEARNAGPETSD